MLSRQFRASDPAPTRFELKFAIGVPCFGIPLQAGFAVIPLIQRHLGRIALRNQPKVLTGETKAQ